MTDLTSNPFFEKFRDQLNERNAQLNLLWSFKTGRDPSGKGCDDVGLFAVCSSGKVKSSTIIVQDYGERDGFGLWIRAAHATDTCIDQILGAESEGPGKFDPPTKQMTRDEISKF